MNTISVIFSFVLIAAEYWITDYIVKFDIRQIFLQEYKILHFVAPNFWYFNEIWQGMCFVD